MLSLDRNGISLVETLLAVGMAAILFVAIAGVAKQNITYFQRMTVRQNVARESRIAMSRMEQIIRNGKAKSLRISTPVAGGLPNSRIDFQLERPLANGATSYAFYWSANKIYGLEYRPNGTQPTEQLADHVTGLMFAGDSYDPAIVSVLLRIDAPLDSTNDPTKVATVILPNTLIRMSEVP